MKQETAKKLGQKLILSDRERAYMEHYERNAGKHLMNKSIGHTPLN